MDRESDLDKLASDDRAEPAPAPDTSSEDCADIRLSRRSMGWIFFGALILRGVVLFQLSQTPFFTTLLGDSLGYHLWAEGLAAGDWVGTGVFYQAPLYPYLLGVLYSLFGVDAFWGKLAQVVLEAFSCVLLASAAARFFGSSRVGLWTGAFASLYAPAIFFTLLIQKATVGFFLTAVALNLLSRVFRTIQRPSLLILLGVSLGLLALARENALIFIVLLIPWLAVKFRDTPPRKRAGWIALLILGASLPLIAVGARNSVVGGEFTLTTSQFGPNFFIGNNANSKGFYLPLRLFRGNMIHERDDAVALAEAQLGRELSPAEVSQFWTGMAMDYIRTEPIDWLGLMTRKALLVWNRVEAADTEDIAAYRHFSWVLDSLARVFHMGVLVPFAAAGLWLTRKRWRELGILYAMLLAYAASLTLFFLFARYRIPLVPILLMFAAAGVEEIRALLGQSNNRRAQFQTGAVVACAAVVANLPLTDTDSQLAATYKNFGSAMIEEGKFSEAVEYLDKSLSYRPELVETLRGMAESLADLGRFSESREYYERILKLEPDHYFASLGLGRVLLFEGQVEAGIQNLERAAEIDPSQSQPYFFLGTHYHKVKNFPKAVEWFRGAVAREESEGKARGEVSTHETRLWLARALFRNGNRQQAAATTRWILKQDPMHTQATMLLARIVHTQGRLPQARALYQKVLEREPGNRRARDRIKRIETLMDAESKEKESSQE